MALQIVFCVETNKRAATDSIYIKETIDALYYVGNDININYVFMGTKTKYNAKEVVKEINSCKREFKIGNTVVIYCVDTDRYDCDQNHARQLKEIEKYTKDNGYKLVWFCHDIEEVYIGESVSDDKKVSCAADFKKKEKIKTVNISKFNTREYQKNSTNILLVLDEYLERK